MQAAVAPPVPEPDIAYNRRGELAPAQSIPAGGGGLPIELLAIGIGLPALGAVAFAPLLLAYAIHPLLAVALALVLLPAAAFGGVVAFRWIGKQRLAAPTMKRVDAIEGVVRWDGAAWRPWVPGPAGWRALEQVSIPPGPFRFYVFNDKVVGAESRLGAGHYSLGLLFAPGYWGTEGVTRAMALPVAEPETVARALASLPIFSASRPPTSKPTATAAGSPPRKAGAPPRRSRVSLQTGWKMRFEKYAADYSHGHRRHESSRSRSRGVELALLPGLRYRVYTRADTGRIVSLELLPG